MIEIWKDIPGYEGYYQASNMGRIRSLDRYVNSKNKSFKFVKGKILKYNLKNNGYYQVNLTNGKYKKYISVHRIIAELFIPNSNDLLQVNHKNGIKSDCNVKNLEWVTASENHKHAYKIGLKNQKGERNNASKLTEEMVRVIRNSMTLTHLELSKIFNVSRQTIGLVLNFKIWAQ